MVKFKSEFPEGGKERRRVIASAEKLSQEFLDAGPEFIVDEYYWNDSSLDYHVQSNVPGREHTTSFPFRKTFKYVLPEGTKSLREYLERSLEPFQGERVFIELGGTGSRVAQEFSPGFFARSYGVTLLDHDKAKGREVIHAERQQSDRDVHHTVIEANVLDDALYKDLGSRLGGTKAALILSRMGKGLQNIPLEPYRMSEILQKEYELLGDEGILLEQTPLGFNNLLREWERMLIEKHPDAFEVRFHKSSYEEKDIEPASTLYLRRKPGAPEVLPMLDPRTVREIGKRGFSSSYRGED